MTRASNAARTDAVVDPGAVVVELGDAAVADGAVFGADRPADQARAAELGQVEALRLRERHYRLQRGRADRGQKRHPEVVILNVRSKLS